MADPEQRISVIIPVVNEAANLQTLIPWLWEEGGSYVAEIIVVDGQSTDNGLEIATKLGARTVRTGMRNRAAQMNAGASASTAPNLYFVHADTLPPKNFAEHLTKLLEKPNSMGCFRYRFRSSSLLLRFNAWFTRLPFMWCQGGDKTFFIRKSCFADLQGYQVHHCIMEEYDFLRRARATHQLYVLPYYATVSARKYEGRMWLRVQIANFIVFNAWRFGVEPQKLALWYPKLLG